MLDDTITDVLADQMEGLCWRARGASPELERRLAHDAMAMLMANGASLEDILGLLYEGLKVRRADWHQRQNVLCELLSPWPPA
jgi:hypothetical protein